MSKTENDLASAYASLPTIDCKRLCHESCGPVAMTRAELKAARKFAPVVARATLAGYHQPVFDFFTLTCSLLDENNACKIYEARPLICRLWGLVKKMACPFGCVPSRWLTDEEAKAVLDQVQRAGT